MRKKSLRDMLGNVIEMEKEMAYEKEGAVRMLETAWKCKGLMDE